MNHGEWVKEVRKALVDRGMTVTELYEKIGIKRTHIYRTLSGKKPLQKTVDRICEELGVERYEVD